MLRALTALALIAASGCSFEQTATMRPAAPNPVERAVQELRHARFGPYTGDAARPLLRDIRCTGLSATRIRCHASWDGHPTKPIVFGVRPNGALYILAAGPLAIS